MLWSGAASLHRRTMAGRVLVLAYHNVIPDGTPPTGDLPNHLPLAQFAAQLTALRATHEIVPLTEALSPQPADARRPRAVVTFDDAYQGAVVHGVAELVRQAIPATIFVAPAFIGGGSFWWDALASPDPSGLDPAERLHALRELRGEDAAVRRWANEQGRRVVEMPSVACAASEAELLFAASQPGIDVGSHSWSHPNLTRMSSDELSVEMARPLQWLRERVPGSLPWIAYPYGLFDQTVARAAAAAGYHAGLGISGGWLTAAGHDPFALPRVNIPPGLSLPGFALRGAGLLAD